MAHRRRTRSSTSPTLDRLARIHDGDAVAGLEDQAEIVRDVDHRGAEFRGDLLDQLDDAGLDRDVERGGRLVEQQQLRVRKQRHGDDDALLLAAGDLVRIGAHDALRDRAGARCASICARALERLLLRDAVMVDRHLGELLADGHRRVQRGHRLLIDHGDLRAADPPQLLLAHGAHVAALEQDLAADDAAVLAHVAA